MSDNPGQIDCTVANDSRLIAAGAAAVSSHAARRAGLSRDAQEEVAEAAIEVCRKAFPEAGAPEKPAPPIRVGVADLPDRIEVTLQAGEAHAPTPPAVIQAPFERVLGEQVRCEGSQGYFHMTILKLCGTQNLKPGTVDSPARR